MTDDNLFDDKIWCIFFLQAKNPTDKPIDGISTYNVVPFEAGQYFNKIQCFCFVYETHFQIMYGRVALVEIPEILYHASWRVVRYVGWDDGAGCKKYSSIF